MFPYTRAATIISLVISVTACSTMNISETDKAPYFDAAFDDKNRAPASFAPASVAVDENGSLDALHLRTQADYYFAMAEAYALEGNSDKAIESYKLVLVYDTNSPTVNLRLAGEYLKKGMITESLAQAQDAVQKNPKSIEGHLLLGGLYSSMKLFPKAMASYNEVLKIQPENTEAPLYIGALYSEQKQPDQAVKYFEILAKNSEYSTPYLAHYYVGRVRLEQAEPKFYKAAEAAFKKSLELKPNFADAVLSLGVLYSRQKQETRAIELYKTFQKENVPNARIAEVLSQVFIEQGDFSSALYQLEVLEEGSSEPLNVQMKIAMILIEQKKYDQAVTKLEEILVSAPESDKVRFYLAAVYEETQKTEKAIAEYKKIPKGSQYYGEAVVHGAYLLKGQGRLGEGLELAAEGIKHKPDNTQIYGIYASLLDEKGDTTTALQVLQKGIKKFPDNAQLRFYFGTLNDRLGKRDVVIAEMKKVLELDPNHVQGMNYLAFTWAEMGENLPEAEELARKALKNDPSDGYVLDTLGWILYKQNKNTEAIKYLEAAHISQAEVSVIAEHLGDAYFKQALVEKAKKMYLKAAQLESDSKKSKEIQSKISAIEKQEFEMKSRLPASNKKPIAENK